MAKKAKRAKKLGNWKVRRVGDKKLMVTIPAGMKMTTKGPISMRPSKYNLKIPIVNGALFINLLSRAVLELDNDGPGAI